MVISLVISEEPFIDLSKDSGQVYSKDEVSNVPENKFILGRCKICNEVITFRKLLGKEIIEMNHFELLELGILQSKIIELFETKTCNECLECIKEIEKEEHRKKFISYLLRKKESYSEFERVLEKES